MRLDEMILQDEGLLFRIGDDGVDLGHLFQQGEGLYILSTRLLEIGIHPMSDVSCFSHIENRPLLILKKIDTRVGGQTGNFLF